MKGPYQFSACPDLTIAFYYSLFGFSKYVCMVSYIERCKYILIISRKNANKKGVSGKFTKNMTRSTGCLFCQRASKFSKTKKSRQMPTWVYRYCESFYPRNYYCFISWNFPMVFFNSRFADVGVFANISELIYLSFFGK